MASKNQVGATTFTTPSDREIVATRVVDAPRSNAIDIRAPPATSA